MLRHFTPAGREEAAAGPVAGCSVFLTRKAGRSYLVTTDSPDKTECIKAFLTYVRAANYTLDIALFSCLHTRIVRAMLKAHSKGVRIRLILYADLFSGKKRKKHLHNAYNMKKKGVDMRWIAPDMEVNPKHRMVIIDASDPQRRPERRRTEVGAIAGEQVFPNNKLVTDMKSLCVVKDPPNVKVWKERFDDLWNTIESESE